MDKKSAGLASVLAVTALAAAHAATPVHEMPRANAYAELLKPIPNAAAALRSADAAALQQKAESKVQLAQYSGDGGGYYHHHHHHHHDYYPPPQWHHHHHHHHHHHWQGGGWWDR